MMPGMEPDPTPQDNFNPTPGGWPEGELASEEKTMGMFCHLAALVGYVIPIPFANVLGPLVVWLTKKESSAFVDDQGRESLNFQITVFIAYLLCIPLMLVAIGFLLLPLIAIASLVFVIIAAVNASGGNPYRYPMTIRFIK